MADVIEEMLNDASKDMRFEIYDPEWRKTISGNANEL